MKINMLWYDTHIYLWGELIIYMRVLHVLNFSNITLQFNTITLFVTVNIIKKSIFLKKTERKYEVRIYSNFINLMNVWQEHQTAFKNQLVQKLHGYLKSYIFISSGRECRLRNQELFCIPNWTKQVKF